MNYNYVLSCCSTCDLSREHLNRIDVKYLCFHYELGGKHYLDDLGQTMTMKDFYAAMVNGAMTRTSQVNVEEYVNFFSACAAEGKDVLHLCLSSGISGTYNSATLAAKQVLEQYPNAKIIVLDTLSASSGFGLFVDKCAELRASGMSIDELANWVVENRSKLQHWFFSTDLTYFVRGGRVSKASGFFGGMLGICPLLNVDYMGRLIARQKCRGKAKVTKEIVNRMIESAQDRENYSEKVYISHSECLEDAKKVAQLVEEAFPKMNGKVLINDIGTTIGAHTGPGTVALFFWGDPRVD